MVRPLILRCPIDLGMSVPKADDMVGTSLHSTSSRGHVTKEVGHRSHSLYLDSA
jgi:hypothetical protein